MTETDVSDVYVRLGNDFNAAVAAFGQFGIEMTCVLKLFLAREVAKITETESKGAPIHSRRSTC
jgi:hypothetical protein